MEMSKKISVYYLIIVTLATLTFNPLILGNNQNTSEPQLVDLITVKDEKDFSFSQIIDDGNFTFENITSWRLSFEITKNITYYRINQSLWIDWYINRIGYQGSISFEFQYSVRSQTTQNQWLALIETGKISDYTQFFQQNTIDMSDVITKFSQKNPMNSSLFGIGLNEIKIDFTIYGKNNQS